MNIEIRVAGMWAVVCAWWAVWIVDDCEIRSPARRHQRPVLLLKAVWHTMSLCLGGSWSIGPSWMLHFLLMEYSDDQNILIILVQLFCLACVLACCKFGCHSTTKICIGGHHVKEYNKELAYHQSNQPRGSSNIQLSSFPADLQRSPKKLHCEVFQKIGFWYMPAMPSNWWFAYPANRWCHQVCRKLMDAIYRQKKHFGHCLLVLIHHEFATNSTSRWQLIVAQTQRVEEVLSCRV